jgi:hypothetical protein
MHGPKNIKFCDAHKTKSSVHKIHTKTNTNVRHLNRLGRGLFAIDVHTTSSSVLCKLLPKSRNNKTQITYSQKQTISKIYTATLNSKFLLYAN